jgi:hypothetical protein
MSAAQRAAILVVASAIASGLVAFESQAQGLFQSLFGFGGQSAPAPYARPAPRSTAPDFRYRENVGPRSQAPAEEKRPAPKSGKFRTMCVRLCDGYYFPISASVSRNDFYRDANACRNRCGAEARLFYHASSSGNATAMTDLNGRAYSLLPNAFRYRKQLVSGCKCRPEPWELTERARHQRYAVEAARDPVPSPGNEAAPPTEPHQLASIEDAMPASEPDPQASPQDEPVRPVSESTAPKKYVGDAAKPSKVPETAIARRRPNRKHVVEAAQPADVPPRTARPKTGARPSRAARGPVPQPAWGLGAGTPRLRWPGD